jgi:putative transport protein
MTWFTTLIHGETIAHVVFVLSLVAALGLALGSLKIKGLGLGIAGVLFSGLAIGHLGITIPHKVLEFTREFGLILFVYTIGIQVGPGFFASLRRQGLPLNMMAASIVLLGAVITVIIAKVANVQMAAAVGLFSGATTNTPSLGAAQEAIRSLPNVPEGASALPGLGYAVAYPFGIIGIILTMLVLRAVFRVDLKKETADLLSRSGAKASKLSRIHLRVTNPNLDGLRLDQIPVLSSLGIVVSRIQHAGEVRIARPDDVIHAGDILLAVGPGPKLDEFRMIVGEVSDADLQALASHLVVRRVIVTKKAILGKSLDELSFLDDEDVTVTRLTRAEVEISATPDQRIQFGDMLVIVGSEESIARVSKALGNSVKQLNHTELIPVFVGIALGVMLGSIPVAFPGIPAPVKLGLAGGRGDCAQPHRPHRAAALVYAQ